MLPNQYVFVREIGDDSYPYWIPEFTLEGSIALEPGEQVLQKGWSVIAKQVGGTEWTLDGLQMVVTDRRLMWFTTKVEEGGGWVGFGAIGLTVALTANVVSQRKAKARSKGKVVVGQIRYEWILGMSDVHEKGLIGIEGASLDIEVTGSAGPVVVHIIYNKTMAEFPEVLARAVTAQRGSLAAALEPTELDALHQPPVTTGAITGPRSKSVRTWAFPGDPEKLMAALRTATPASEKQTNPHAN